MGEEEEEGEGKGGEGEEEEKEEEGEGGEKEEKEVGEGEEEEGEKRREKRKKTEERGREKYWLSSVMVFKGVCSHLRTKRKPGDVMSVKYLTLVNLMRKVHSHLFFIFCSGGNLEHVLCHILIPHNFLHI